MKKFLSLLLILVLILTGGVLAHTVRVRVNGIDLQMTSNGGSGITVESKVTDINGWSATGIALTDEQQHSTSVEFTMPDNSVELEATIQKSLITYDANGGTGAPINQTKSLGVDIVLSTLEPTMVGCTFIEWNTAVNGSGTRYMPGDTYSLDADLTLYAQWSGAVNFTWDTTGQLSKSIQVKTTAATTINWGDGTVASVASSPSSNVILSHTYASAGNYTVRIMDNVVMLLNCVNYKVHSLDVSAATVLTHLECSNNPLTSLDVSNNTALVELYCAANQLTSLDVSNNIELFDLNCCQNQLTSLDVSNNISLNYLECSSNRLTSLNVSNNTALYTLACDNYEGGNNALTSLDVSNNLALSELYCEQPSLNILIVDSRCNAPAYEPFGNLERHANTNMVTLTQTPNGKITYAGGYSFNITPDVGSQVISITAGGIAQTPATTYDFGSLAADTTLTATFGNSYVVTYDANGGIGSPQPQSKLCGTNLTLTTDVPTNEHGIFDSWNTAPDGSGTTYYPGGTYSMDANVVLYAQWAVIELTWDTTGQLAKSIQLYSGGATTIDWGDGQTSNVSQVNDWVAYSHNYTSAGIYTVKIKDNVIQGINCNSSKVNYIDVNNATGLYTLICNTNQLTSLNLTYNTILTGINCADNSLTSLDVSHNPNLVDLYCGSNQLTSLDVSNNTALVNLACNYNNLTSLNVSNNTALLQLGCYGNNFSSLNVSNNTLLQLLNCGENPSLGSLDVSNNTALYYLACGATGISSLNVSNNTYLQVLYCDTFHLTSLDVSHNLSLSALYCKQSTMNILVTDSRQNITTLDRHANTKVVTITQTANGTISYASGYSFNITPNSGYAVASLTAGGVAQTPATTYNFGSLSNDTTLTATFGVPVTLTFLGMEINTGLSTVTLDCNGSGVPVKQSSLLALQTNTDYVVSFDYQSTTTNTFDVDLCPDDLPEIHPTATTSNQHYDWTLNSASSNMASCNLRFFDDIDYATDTGVITISNIGMSQPTYQNKTYGGTLGTLPTPTRAGCTFAGWWTAPTGGTQISSSTAVPATNTTYYAHWTVTLTTGVYTNGVLSSAGGYVTGAGTYDVGSQVTLTAVANSGYRFTNFYDATAGGIESYNTTLTVTLNSNYYVEVGFVQQYTITYNANGGSGAPEAQLKDYGSSLTLSSTIPTKSNYMFNGWNTAQNGSGTPYAAGATYSANENVTLYAQWGQLITPAVGSYISYSGGDYTGLWVVLRNTTGAWEIISKESVGNQSLSGADGYANAVQILNNKCATYVNSTYAVSARSVGATSSSIGQINTTDNPLTFAAARNHVLPYEDTYYEADQSIISGNENLKHSSGNVWLASRHLRNESSRSVFDVRFLYTSGSMNSYGLFYAGSGGSTSTLSVPYGVRPVVTLKSGIWVTGGTGVADDPYTIGI